MYIEHFKFDIKEGEIVNLLERHDFWVLGGVVSYSCVWEACPAQVDVFYMQKELCCVVLCWNSCKD